MLYHPQVLRSVTSSAKLRVLRRMNTWQRYKRRTLSYLRSSSATSRRQSSAMDGSRPFTGYKS